MTYSLKLSRFLGWFVGLTIGLPILLLLIDWAVGVNLDSSAVSIIPMFIAAMQEGTAFAKAERRRPESKEAWKLAWRMTLLAAAATLILSVVHFFIFPDLGIVLAQMEAGNFAILAVFVVLLFGFMFLVARFFFGLGARNQMKVIDKVG